MISTCDKAKRPITATANGQLPQAPGTSGEEGAAEAAGKSVGTKNHCCLMLQGLQELRNNDTLCDYSLFADGEVRNKFPVVLPSATLHDYTLFADGVARSLLALCQ